MEIACIISHEIYDKGVILLGAQRVWKFRISVKYTISIKTSQNQVQNNIAIVFLIGIWG